MNRIEFSRRWRRVTAVIAGGLPACGCLLLGSGVLLNKTFDWAGLLAAVGMFAFVAMIPASFLNSTDTDRLWAWKEAWRAWLFGSDPHGMGSSAARRVWRALWPMATAAGLLIGGAVGGSYLGAHLGRLAGDKSTPVFFSAAGMALAPVLLFYGAVLAHGIQRRVRLRRFGKLLVCGAHEERLPEESRLFRPYAGEWDGLTGRVSVLSAHVGWPQSCCTLEAPGTEHLSIAVERTDALSWIMRRFQVERTARSAADLIASPPRFDLASPRPVDDLPDEPPDELFQSRAVEARLAILLEQLGWEQLTVSGGHVAVTRTYVPSDSDPRLLEETFTALREVARLCQRQTLQGERRFGWTAGSKQVCCPYCRDSLPVEETTEVAGCDRCGTLHHAACLEEAGSCTIFGCEGAATRAASTTSLPLPEGPDRLRESSCCGCVTAPFGLGLLLAAAVASVSGVEFDGVRVGGWLGALGVLGLVLVGGLLVFLAGGDVIDRRERKITDWFGLRIPFLFDLPFWRKVRSLEGLTEVTLTKQTFQSTDSGGRSRSQTTFPVRLTGPAAEPWEYRGGGGREGARERAERLAKFLSLPMRDTSLGPEHLRQPAELDQPLRERLREQKLPPAIPRPAHCKTRVLHESPQELSVELPKQSAVASLLWLTSSALLVAGSVYGLAEVASLGTQGAGAAKAACVTGLILGGLSLLSALLSTRPCVIRLTGQALALESRGTLRRKIEQIPLDELEELHVGLHSVLAQSDARALWLGCPGIEADELQWLRDALLRRIVASASPPQ